MDQVKPFWKENSLSTDSNQGENVGAIKDKDWKDSFLLVSNALFCSYNFKRYDDWMLFQVRRMEIVWQAKWDKIIMYVRC